MLTLCGFARSNYYNKVKLALMEKGIAFEEGLIWKGKDALSKGSPLGKIPFLKAENGDIVCESSVILEYLEDQYPAKPLMPKDAFAKAKVRELMTMLELYVELVAREMYLEAFFGGKVSDEIKTSCETRLKKGIQAFLQLAKFSPYIAGETFTLVDCAAIMHFPVISMATKAIYGTDFLADTPVQDYLVRMGAMPSMQKILADRKVNVELMKQVFSAH